MQYVKIGIADPTIQWIDLGASRRSAKTAIGFTGYPVRCVGLQQGNPAAGLADRQASAARQVQRLLRWPAKRLPRSTFSPLVCPSAGLPGPSLPPSSRSIYIRCKNSVQEALYSQMMAIYFKASKAATW